MNSMTSHFYNFYSLRWWVLERERVMANYFAKADLNDEDKIRAEHMIKMFEANNIKLDEEELQKIAEITDAEGKISRINYWNFLWKHCKEWNGKMAIVEKSNAFQGTNSVNRRLKIEAVLRNELRFVDNKSTAATKTKRTKSEKMDEIFRLFDKDKDGKISREEFKQMEKHLKKDQVDSVLEMFNQAPDGKLNKSELEKAIRNKTKTSN